LIPHVVDEIAYQTRRNLAQRALADIVPFTREDQQAIRAGATRLAQGQAPAGLPPRHLVSAAAYALTSGRVAPRALAERVVGLLNRRAPSQAAAPAPREALAA
jgi:hypothetical protein